MVIAIDEEAYLAQHGAGRMQFGDCAMHKNIQEGRQKRFLLKRMSEKDRLLLKKRDTLRKEYSKKVKAGELRPPSRTERLISIANGHPDNEQTQSARRLLKKRGYIKGYNKGWSEGYKEGFDEVYYQPK